MQAAGLTAVAERPQQVRGGDVAQVPRDRPVVGTELREPVDERLGHALREEVIHAFGCRHRIQVDALVVLVEDAERSKQCERAHGLGSVGREVDREHAADRCADHRAREPSLAGIDRVPEHGEPAEVVVGSDEVPAAVEAAQLRDDDVPSLVGELCRGSGEGAGISRRCRRGR